jgi:hypothetical protein
VTGVKQSKRREAARIHETVPLKERGIKRVFSGCHVVRMVA